MKFIVDTEHWTITTVMPNGSSDKTLSWFDDSGLALLSQWWLQSSWQRKYSYQFRWLGRPIIQLPTDILMMQDLIHRIRPTLIIETGIAHGGSAVFHASILKLLHAEQINSKNRPHVVAIDIDIRPQNREALDEHPLRPMMTLIEGSSTSEQTAAQVRQAIRADDTVMVVLDSNHTCDHVLAELNRYAPLVTPGSAIVVMDGVMAQLAGLPGGDPKWTSDNPTAAIEVFLQSSGGKPFSVDHTYDAFAFTHSPGGVLLRTNH